VSATQPSGQAVKAPTSTYEAILIRSKTTKRLQDKNAADTAAIYADMVAGMQSGDTSAYTTYEAKKQALDVQLFSDLKATNDLYDTQTKDMAAPTFGSVIGRGV
jgi:hypothetical protein